MSSPVTPVVRGLYVCEVLEKHPVTGNFTLHNCFRAIKVPLPGTPRPFYVVAYLADGAGEVGCRTEITRPDTLTTIFKSDAVIRFSHPLEEQRLVVKVECAFPVAGSYDIILWLNGELAALSPLAVKPLLGV